MKKIIDSHVHFWDPQKLRYAWLDNLPALNRAYLANHVPAQAGDFVVEGIVFVQADCATEQGLDEVEFVTALATQDSRIGGIVAFAPLERGEGARAYLDKLRPHPLVRGVRRLIQDEPAGFCLAPEFIAGVRLLPGYDLRFDICIRHWQLKDAIVLASACPEVQFVLDHIGKPDICNHAFEPWRQDISEIATLPNVWCKLSGLVTEADANWAPGDLQPYIRHVVNAFGAERVMFGSDAPVAYLASTYEKWVETLQNAIQNLPDADQEKLWHENAAEFYRL